MVGLPDRPILETPIAVVDLETTGLSTAGDRIIEIAIVRVEPNKEPELVLNTLVNPNRQVAATEIHGITDADVVDAPSFRDIAGNFLAAIGGCVFASYNVYFDAKFAQSELAAAGVNRFPPLTFV
ncbi:MAG: 3'-5' exonuclease [Acidobacteria bacterium]|nr:3'-5' exonuclease [Acidobacteriota bacterium]